MTKINVAIDGPAGAGKTTIGKLLAQKLNYHFLDSGLLFRHLAWFCQKNNFSEPDKSEQLKSFLATWKTQNLIEPKKLISQLEKERPTLNSAPISDLASRLAQFSEVREILLHFQRQLTFEKGWVVVGRDITSQVLPNAEVKIFLTASLEARVKRRFQQQSTSASQDQVEKELRQRDQRDQTRSLAPLIKTADSWELDTTHLSPEESVNKILLCFKTRL